LVQPIEQLELLATVRAALRTKRAEAGQRRSVRLVHRTFEAIQEALVVVDVDGTIEQCNAAAGRLLGTSCELLVGHVLQVPQIVELGGAEIVARIAPDAAQRFEREATIGGRTFRVTADPLRDELGHIEGAVVIFHDISLTKRLEEAQRTRADELAEASRRKDEFLGMLAHELRNPLNAISSAATVLARGGVRDTVRLHDIIHRQVRNLARLVDDLLEVSRITRGRLQLRLAPVDLVDVVRRSVEAIRPEFEARHQRLSLTLPSASILVLGDDLRLEQVLMNLLANASKYSEPRGETVVELVPDGDNAAIRVRDDGIGLPPEMLGKVFEPFVQVDQSLSRSLGGLGIGLTMVRSLVELHGGVVHANSDGLGRGSAFVVRLPIARGATLPTAAPVSTTPAVDARALRVLVVEDNEETLEVLQLLLESMGHEVTGASEGNGGLRAALTIRPDIALVDIGLPGIDGYELAKRLRGADPRGDIYLVAVTGYGRPEDRARALEAGFDHYLVKPIHDTALVDALDRSRGERPRRAAE
ncbi:MAG TPA: ATP-binding protein, partial [Nannocystaceae bacterium]|nr:ATP-binding protein [Nannocystaceae bacterium]